MMEAIALFAGAAPASALSSDLIQVSPPPSTLNLANEQQILDVFDGINAFRANKGLDPVRFNVTASEVAEDWSDFMAAEQVSYHNPDYPCDPRVANRWAKAGEIIAARWDTTGQGLVNQWDASPGHNKIMSDPGLTTIGVGIAITGNKDSRNLCHRTGLLRRRAIPRRAALDLRHDPGLNLGQFDRKLHDPFRRWS